MANNDVATGDLHYADRLWKIAVTMSRDIAARLYGEIRKLRPAWHEEDDARGAMKVIMRFTETNVRHVKGELATSCPIE